MYTFDGIILEKQILREKQIRITVLTKEYGKITVWSKKALTGVDIGDIARLIVKRDKSTNTLKNIQVTHYLIRKKWQFETLYAFLTLIKTLSFCTAEEDISATLFEDYATILKNIDTITLDQCLLFRMRIFKELGSLNPQFFENDAVLRYMYQHINSTPLLRILHAKPLEKKHRDIIEKSNQFAFSAFV